MDWCDECGSWEWAGDLWDTRTIDGVFLLCSWCLDEYKEKGWLV